MFALRVIVLVVSLFASLAAGPTFALADTGSTPSPTPTDTTAPVTSPSDTPSPSPTDSPSPAPSPTGNPSPSPSPTDSPSPEPSPTPTDAASASPSPSPTPTATGPTAGLIVQMFSGLTSDQEQAVIANDGGTETGSVPALRMFFIDVPASDVSSYVQAYESDPNVVSVDRDRNRDTQGAPSDPAYPDQWALPQIGWDQAYGSVNLSGSATIAVLDTGVDGSTSDLSGSLVPGWSAFGADPTSDPNGHGTWLASIAAAATNNGDGIAGVDYAGANIMPVQVLDANGTGQDSDIINGLVWAVSNGANVVLMGFSNPGYSQALQDAVSYAWSHGVVLVAATGNDGVSTPNYPAGDAHVVGVAATDFGDPLWGGSNYGVDTLIAAPGVGITADAVGGGTVSVTGTSTSAAIVAGAAAALIEEDPSAGPGVIVGRLARNADPAGTQDQTGNGRLNLDRSLQDSSSDPVDPAGAPGGGPFVGPYVAAARNLNVFFAGSGGGSVTVSVPGSDTISYPTTGSGACTGATGNGTSSVTIVASCNLNTTGTPNASITATPNGTSSFTSWASSPSLGTCTGSNSATTCSTGTLPGGQNAVTVTFTGLRTSSTALLCSPASVPVNAPTSCTATVADTSSGTPTTPTGSVSFSGGTGSFSPASCTLSSGSCSVNFTPAAGSEGSQSLTATYGGDSLHSGSAGSFSITATKRSSTTTVNCSPASGAINVSTTCTATVADNSAGTAIRPGGTVSFSGGTGSFSPTSCTLPAPGRTPAR